MEEYHELSKGEIKKKYGLSNETFNFYLSVGLIKESINDKILFLVDRKADSMHLEKSTVFKYCFEDGWIRDIKTFEENIKYNGKVKYYTEEEIARLNKKVKKDV